MTIHDMLANLEITEDRELEFKAAQGGLPRSLWESYSAMANTDGGLIILGVKESDGGYVVEGLPNVGKLVQEFWNLANNRQKVSVNLLSNDDVSILQVSGRSVVVLRVPRATRWQRPVFLGSSPFGGTYRRHAEGDYQCTDDEVRRMFADQSDQPADSAILEHFSMDDLDPVSLSQYRNRFASRAPGHPWLGENDQVLLEKLGGWRIDRAGKREGVTVAGLLMFGKDEAIRDPAAIPQYHVDYREKLSDSPAIRWTDRLTIDGTWVGNLFQFYQKVILRLTADIKIPFQLNTDLFRRDDTIVHEAIREALVNALIHADYRGLGGVVVEKYRDRFELSNPGSLLVSIEQIVLGGVSECRNKSLQIMFQMIGGGEKAGSGMDKIRRGWASQQWRVPLIKTQMRPDRVKLVLPMVSLLPEKAVQNLRGRFGVQFDALESAERQAVVTAEAEGEVSNGRLQQISTDHPSDISQMLQRLVARGFLTQFGKKRGATYQISPETAEDSVVAESDSTPSELDSTHSESDSTHSESDSTHSESNSTHSEPNSTHSESNSTHSGPNSTHSASNSTHSEPDSTHSGSNSTHSEPNSTHSEPDSTHSEPDSTRSASNSTHSESNSTHSEPDSTHSESGSEVSHEQLATEIASLLEALGAELQDLYARAQRRGRLARQDMCRLIIGLCQSRFLTPRQLAGLLNRRAISLQQHYLRGMVESGNLALRYADEPNHPQQAYRATVKPVN